MERHKCKLCFKSFSNGRALGGHMRSHLLNLPIPPKPEQELPIQLSEDKETASSSSSSEEEVEAEQQGGGGGEGEEEGDEEEEEKGGLCYGLRENPKRSIRLVDPEFSFAVDAASVVLQDRESETESSRNPTRRRSKRARKLLENQQQHHQRQRQEIENKAKKLNCFKLSKTESSWAEPEPVLSSISDTTTEEDVAFCLMMLSRDNWKRAKQQNRQEQEHEEEEEEEEEEAEDEKSVGETDESDEFKSCRTRIREMYKCETCNKVFKSYQALGGHRASHKKLKVFAPTKETGLEPENAATSSSTLAEKKIYECPYCFRVFSSGQALGGHKRSHLSGAAAPPAGSSAKFGDNSNLIDLNLPAPVEDDDISQIELSAVSDAEFVNYIKR